MLVQATAPRHLGGSASGRRGEARWTVRPCARGRRGPAARTRPDHHLKGAMHYLLSAMSSRSLVPITDVVHG